MKNYLTIIFGVILIVCGGSFFLWSLQVSKPVVTKNTTEFKLTSIQIVDDLKNKFVTVSPYNQVWGFTSEQKVDLKVLQVKYHPMDDSVAIVSAKIDTTAKVQPEKSKTPVVLHLTGLIKLQYELIANEWHLTDIINIGLRMSQEEK